MKNRSLVLGAVALFVIMGGVLLVTASVQGAALSTISGKVFSDQNADGTFSQGEAGTRGVAVRLYRDLNGNGLVDRGDSIVAPTTSDSLGDYRLSIAETGRFVVRVDAGALPRGERLTTSSQHALFIPSARAKTLPTVETGRADALNAGKQVTAERFAAAVAADDVRGAPPAPGG